LTETRQPRDNAAMSDRPSLSFPDEMRSPPPRPANPIRGWVSAIVWALFIEGLLLGLALYADQPVAQWFDQPKFDLLRLDAREITNIGLAEHWFGLAAIIFITCQFIIPRFPKWAARRVELIQNWRLAGVHLFFALITSGIFLHVIKFMVGRQRPHLTTNHAPMVFVPFSWHWHWQSFPSGHSQTLFSVAAMAAVLWPRLRWVIYILAAAFAMTRVVILQHFLSDAAGGAIIGYLGAQLSFHLVGARISMPNPLSNVRHKTRL